jgi:hypothetical protein
MAKAPEGTESNGKARGIAGVVVVTLGLIAVVLSLLLVLDNYDTENETATSSATETTPASSTTVQTQSKGKGKGKGTGSEPAPVTPAPVPPSPVTDSSSVSASSAVAVLTPVIAAIVGIVGLFFGISATGSARGKEAEAEQVKDARHKAEAELSLAELRKPGEEGNLGTGGTAGGTG